MAPAASAIEKPQGVAAKIFNGSESKVTPLYRCLLDPSGTTTKYLVGYRAVTLIPFADAGSLQPYKTADVSSVSLILGEGAAGPQNIEIRCENIYIYTGSKFNFPGKSVKITANKIFCIARPSGIPSVSAPISNTPSIEINCSGLNLKDNIPPIIQAGAPGRDVLLLWHNTYWVYGRHNDMGPATADGNLGGPGAPGSTGQNGRDGNPGGQITLRGHLVSLLPKTAPACKLFLNVRGGYGDKGQNGGDGGKGGNLQLPEGLTAFIRKAPFLDPTAASYTGPGGKGGAGGNAGQAGASGKVVLSNTTDSLFTIVTQADPSDVVPVVQGGTGGNGGPRGKITGPVNEWHIENDDGASYLGKWPANGQPGEVGASVKQISGPISQRFLSDNVKSDQYSGYHIDAVHVMMVLQRLQFEYQMTFGTQIIGGLQTQSTPQTQAFTDSLAWLKADVELMKKVAMHSFNPTVTLQAAAAFQSFQQKISQLLDNYGNHIIDVPNPSVGLMDVKPMIQALADVEQMQTNLETLLENAQVQAADVADAGIGFLQDSKDQQDKIDNLSGQLRAQIIVVRQNLEPMQTKRAELASSLQSFYTAVQEDFSRCTGISGSEGLLSSASTVLMFANPEAGAMYAMGSAISLGQAASQMSIEHGDPAIDKTLMQSTIVNIKSDVADMDLMTQIGTVAPNSLLIAEQDPSLATTITADRDAFTALCKKYFNDHRISGMQALKETFNDFIHSVQELKLSQQKYNAMVVAYLKAISDLAFAKQNYESLQQAATQLSSPTLEMIYTFFSHAATEQKTATLQALYEWVRAYNCASLQKSQVFNEMAVLASYDEITSDILKTTYNFRLIPEIQAFNKSRNLNPPTLERSRIISITAATHPLLFSQFKSKGSLIYVPLTASKTESSLQNEWYDIRLNDFRVFLIGAEKKGAAENYQKFIDVNIKFGSLFTVQDRDMVEHDFQMPPRELTFTYSYANAPNLDGSLSQQSSLSSTGFRYTTNENDTSLTYVMPLASPFTQWRIAVKDSAVDLTNLSEIRIDMDVLVRTNTSAPPSVKAITPLHFNTLRATATTGHAVVREFAGTDEAHYADVVHMAVSGLVRTERAAIRHNLIFVKTKTGLRIFTFIHATLPVQRLALKGPGQFAQRLTSVVNLMKPNFKQVRPIGLKALQLTQPYGNTPDQIVTGMLGASEAKRRQVSESIYNEIIAQFNKNGGSRTSQVLNGYQVAEEGHRTVSAAVVALDSKEAGDHALNPKTGPRDMLRSFPGNPDLLLLNVQRTREIEKLSTPDEKFQYMKDNNAAIRTELKELVEKGGDMKGCSAWLGSSSFVKVADVIPHETESFRMLIFTPVTGNPHTLDGANQWALVVDKNRPLELMMFNIMYGRHPSVIADAVNANIGVWVMNAALETFVQLRQADINQTPLRDYLKKFDRRLEFVHRVVGSLDYFAKTIADFRTQEGPNTDSSKVIVRELPDGEYPTTIEEMDNLPETAQEAGIFVDGLRTSAISLVTGQDMSAAGSSFFNPWTEAQRAVANDIISRQAKYLRSDADKDALKQDVTEVITRYTPDYFQDADGNLRSPDTIYSTLTTDEAIDFRHEVTSKIRAALLGDEALVAMADAIMRHTAFATSPAQASNPDTIIQFTREISERALVTPMILPGGMVETWVQQNAVELLQPEAERRDMDSIVESSIAAYKDQGEAVRDLAAARAKLPRGDPKVVEADKKLKEAEDFLQELEEKERAAKEAKALADAAIAAERQEDLKREETKRSEEYWKEKKDKKDKEERPVER